MKVSESPESCQLLHVEDNPADVRLVAALLEEDCDVRFEIRHSDSLSGAKNLLLTAGALTPDVMLLDLGLPDRQGLETLNGILPIATDVPIVVLTGLDDEQLGRSAVARGAEDYLQKQQVSSPGLLRRTLDYAISRHHRRKTQGIENHDPMASGEVDRCWFDDPASQGESVAFRDRFPDVFEQLIGRYTKLLEAHGQDAVDSLLGEHADAILAVMTKEDAQPSDLVDLHSTALRLATGSGNGDAELRERARFVSLTMMARLAGAYRRNA